MATSAEYDFVISNTAVLTEAFERCLIDPATLTGRHMVSGRRTLTLALMALNQQGLRQYTIDQQTLTLTEGTATYNLPTGTQDILDAVVRRDDNDVPMAQLSRSEYLQIPTKTQEGMPIQWVINKTQLAPKTITLWPVPENSTDTIVYNRIVWPQSAGSATEDPYTPPEFVEALCAEVAWRLALKYAPRRVADLKALAAEALMYATQENRERSPMTITVAYGGGP